MHSNQNRTGVTQTKNLYFSLALSICRYYKEYAILILTCNVIQAIHVILTVRQYDLVILQKWDNPFSWLIGNTLVKWLQIGQKLGRWHFSVPLFSRKYYFLPNYTFMLLKLYTVGHLKEKYLFVILEKIGIMHENIFSTFELSIQMS